MPPSSSLAPRKRLWQFSLSTLFLLLTVFCVWLGLTVNRANQQRRTVALMTELGGKVELPGDYCDIRYDYEIGERDGSHFFHKNPQPPGPKWLRDLLGVDYFAKVVWVRLDYVKITDDVMRQIAALPHLKGLGLVGSKLSNDQLVYLRKPKRLRWLYLSNTGITGEGLVHLRDLSELQVLELRNNQIDSGLKHIAGLPKLHHLDLTHTDVSDASLAHFVNLHDLRTLGLAGTAVSDTGLQRLEGLAKLKQIYRYALLPISEIDSPELP